MKEKILSFLKTKLNGVQENYLSRIADHYAKTVTEESQIETTLTDGVIDLLKLNAAYFQTEGDRRATEAANTALKNFRKKHGLDENGKPINTGDPTKKDKDDKPDPDEPAWFKAYREAKDAEIAELKNTFEQQKKEKALSALIDKVKTHDKLKGIPASFLKGRNLVPGSEDEIDQLAASIEADYSAFKQEMAEQGVHISVPPAGGSGIKEGAALGKAIAEKKNTNTSDGVKGKTI